MVFEYFEWGCEGGFGDGEFCSGLFCWRVVVSFDADVMLTGSYRCKCRWRLASSVMCCAATTRLR